MLLAREAAGPAGDGRRDRRRQVRHHVPVAGAVDARHGARRSSPISTSDARAASSRSRRLGRRGLTRPPSLGDAVRQAAARMSPPTPQRCIAFPDIEVIVEATGVPDGRHPPRAQARSRTASTSSW